MSARAVRLRRRSKPTLAARLRTYWIVLAVVAVLAVAAGWALATAPAFRASGVEVAGTTRVSKASVVARAALDPGANVWLVDTGAMERRIEALPFVAGARVHRFFPARVRIDVAERVPSGCVTTAGGLVTVDDADRVLASECLDAALPQFARALGRVQPGTFVHDARLDRLREDARALGGGETFRTFAFDRFEGLDATLASGAVVHFGDDDDLAAKQRLVAPILAELGKRAARLRAIDLRAPGTPVVEFR